MGYAMRPLTEDELSKYLDVLQEAPEGRKVYAAIAAIAIGTGARIGEILTMRVKDVVKDGKVREKITRKIEKKRKTVYRDTCFPIRELRDLVQRYVESPTVQHRFPTADDFLFSVRYAGGRLGYYSCWRVQKKLLHEAGLPETGIGFHGLRKTILTLVYYNQYRISKDMLGAVRYVQQIAGHESINVTIRYLGWDVVADEKRVLEESFEKIANRIRQNNQQ